MSGSVYWRPISKKIKHIDTPSSSFRSAMERVFGHPPWSIGSPQLHTLSGMAAVYDVDNNPYQDIIDAIHEYGDIEIWIEY